MFRTSVCFVNTFSSLFPISGRGLVPWPISLIWHFLILCAILGNMYVQCNMYVQLHCVCVCLCMCMYVYLYVWIHVCVSVWRLFLLVFPLVRASTPTRCDTDEQAGRQWYTQPGIQTDSHACAHTPKPVGGRATGGQNRRSGCFPRPCENPPVTQALWPGVLENLFSIISGIDIWSFFFCSMFGEINEKM